jgi:hypothetical protein
MTPMNAAMTSAWFMIALLSLGFAGLMRHVQLLTREMARPSGREARTADITGYRLPPASRLAQALSPGRVNAALFVSPSCSTCHRLIDQLAALTSSNGVGDLLLDRLQAQIISTGDCPPVAPALDPIVVCMPNAGEEHQLLHVTATPWLIIVGPDAVIVYSGPAGSTDEVVSHLVDAVGERDLVPSGTP